MRRRMPQVTTKGPESHKIRKRGGRLRKARTRSPHALLMFCLASGIKIYDAVRSARAAPDWFQITCACSHPCAAVSMTGYSRSGRIPRRPERAFYQGGWRAASRPAMEMLPLLTMCVWAKLRVRALDERWTRLFVSKFIRLLSQVAEATPALQDGPGTRWHGCVRQLPAA
jgi:hypothetical protein